LTTTLRAYADLKSTAAFQRYDDLIESLTERGQKRARQPSRGHVRMPPKKPRGNQHV
jgi:hypothetical protein